MSSIPLTNVPDEDLQVTPIAPNGTIVILQIAEEPKIETSDKYLPDKAYYMSIIYVIIEAKGTDSKMNSILKNVVVDDIMCLPGTVYQENCSFTGYRYIKDNFATFKDALGLTAGDLAKESCTSRMVGKKVKATLSTEEYQGKMRNRVGAILNKA